MAGNIAGRVAVRQETVFACEWLMSKYLSNMRLYANALPLIANTVMRATFRAITNE